MKPLKIIYNFIPGKYRRKLYFFYFTVLISNLLDVIGIGLFFPALNFLINQQTGFQFIDNYFEGLGMDNNSIVIIILSLICFLFFLKNLLVVLIITFQTRFTSELSYDLSKDLFNQYLSMPLRFHTSLNSSKLLRNTSDEIFIFVKYIVNSILYIFSDLSLLIVFTILLISVSTYETILIIIIFSFLSFTIYFLFKNKISIYGNKRLVIAENVLKFLREGFYSIREIKIYNIKNFFTKRYREEGQKTIPLSIFVNLIGILPRVIFEVFAVILFVILIIYSVNVHDNFNELIPTLSIYVLSIYRIAPGMSRILQHFQKIKHYMPSFYTVKNAFIENMTNMDNSESITDPTYNFEKIEFRNISFGYKDDKILFKNINFSLSKNEKILIRGKSGCGKSTFLDLMCGFVEPKEGELIINGKVALDNDKKKLISVISYVSQSPFFVDDDLVKNIALGIEENININKIIEILEVVELSEFAEKIKKNIYPKIGERGSLISGGQKQRIALARAIYFDPQILILDEATNSIDYDTEMKIFKNIDNYLKNLTLIKVSHAAHDYKNLFTDYKLEGNIITKI